MKVACPDLNGRGEVVTLPPTQPKNLFLTKGCYSVSEKPITQGDDRRPVT